MQTRGRSRPALDRHKLLHGPYQAPALQRGDRATCLHRDAEVVITSWTDAPIPWPRCRAIGVRGSSGLLITEELVRAIRTEASLAIQYWWGARGETVAHWGKLLIFRASSTHARLWRVPHAACRASGWGSIRAPRGGSRCGRRKGCSPGGTPEAAHRPSSHSPHPA